MTTRTKTRDANSVKPLLITIQRRSRWYAELADPIAQSGLWQVGNTPEEAIQLWIERHHHREPSYTLPLCYDHVERWMRHPQQVWYCDLCRQVKQIKLSDAGYREVRAAIKADHQLHAPMCDGAYGWLHIVNQFLVSDLEDLRCDPDIPEWAKPTIAELLQLQEPEVQL
ncbi:hypothetical protein [Ktedonobacter racemifer]|uniref:Uncharacterized protein n=1 Tax=Ktedonobacter racemifer DSM 44963 TaxID=485913 RepID=D6U8T0_KTERA|nr:hypothetical protein [Ktedonobacter racemifer]EFH79640.1 hypothetical protein Krac_0118 [Ktedonobacter racemifer DSM 44963]